MKQLRDVRDGDSTAPRAIGATGYVLTHEENYIFGVSIQPVLTLNGMRDVPATVALRDAVAGMPRNAASALFIADWVEQYARENIG